MEDIMHHSPEDGPGEAPRVQCGDVTYVPVEPPITRMTPRTSDISFLQHYPSKHYGKMKYEVGGRHTKGLQSLRFFCL